MRTIFLSSLFPLPSPLHALPTFALSSTSTSCSFTPIRGTVNWKTQRQSITPVSMPSISPTELPLRTILCNPTFGAFLTPILFVLNLIDEDFTCHSGDWSSWKDKSLKRASGTWMFGVEHGMFFVVFSGCLASMLMVSNRLRSWGCIRPCEDVWSLHILTHTSTSFEATNHRVCLQRTEIASSLSSCYSSSS